MNPLTQQDRLRRALTVTHHVVFGKYDLMSRNIIARITQPPFSGSRVYRLCYSHCCKDIILHAHKPGVYRYKSSQGQIKLAYTDTDASTYRRRSP